MCIYFVLPFNKDFLFHYNFFFTKNDIHLFKLINIILIENNIIKITENKIKIIYLQINSQNLC